MEWFTIVTFGSHPKCPAGPWKTKEEAREAWHRFSERYTPGSISAAGIASCKTRRAAKEACISRGYLEPLSISGSRPSNYV